MVSSVGRIALTLATLVALASFVRADEPVPAEAPAPQPAVAEPAPAVVEPAPATLAPTAGVDLSAKPPGPVSERKDDVPRPSYKLCIGLGVGAVAALVTGGALGGVAKSREAEQNGDSSSPPLYTPELVDRGKQAETIAIVGYTFLGIGGALAIADVVLWVERLRKPPHKKPLAERSRPVAVSATASGLKVTF